MTNSKDDRCTRYDDHAQGTDDSATLIAVCHRCIPETREEAMQVMDGIIRGDYQESQLCGKHITSLNPDGSETIGDVVAPTLNDAALEDCERVLRRFEAVAIDEMDDVPAWLVTAHSVVQNTREYSDREVRSDHD